MQITVREIGYTTTLNEDGEFKCPHENVEVIPPCCTTAGSSGYIECSCGGGWSVYCQDCDNDDLEDWQAVRIMSEYE